MIYSAALNGGRGLTSENAARRHFFVMAVVEFLAVIVSGYLEIVSTLLGIFPLHEV